MSNLTLLKVCASDLDVVNAARVSFAQQHEFLEKGDDKLINFLLKNKHGTPFEHNFFKFYVEAPIFVFREWHRHRIGHSYNEMSGRYVELPEVYYEPDEIRVQHGKPGAYTYDPIIPMIRLIGVRSFRDFFKEELAIFRMKAANKRSFRAYRKLLKAGVAKEQARSVLPVATHSQMIWSCNARSLMAFLTLRAAPTALKEIRELAEDAEQHLAKAMPITYESFVKNGRQAP